MMNCGQAWTLIGEISRGREALDQARRAVPHDVLCWQFHWINIAMSGDANVIEHELPRVEQEIGRYPNHPMGPLLWGCCGFMKAVAGDPEGAINALRRCYDVAPGIAAYAASLAALLHVTGKPDDARVIVQDLSDRGFKLTSDYMANYRAAISQTPIPGLLADLL